MLELNEVTRSLQKKNMLKMNEVTGSLQKQAGTIKSYIAQSQALNWIKSNMDTSVQLQLQHFS